MAINASNAHLFATDQSRHLAVQTRSPLAHSAFIYSVITTKIYCRPTCPSRPARRANIIFHDTPAQASADGFRPCKRCYPDDAGEDGQLKMVRRVCELISNETVDGEKWSVKALAKDVGLTESHFCRMFKKMMGVTVGEYRAIERARGLESAASTASPGSHETPIVGDVPSLPLSPIIFEAVVEDTRFDVWDESAYQRLLEATLDLDSFVVDLDDQLLKSREF